MRRNSLTDNSTDLLPKKINCVNNNYFGETLKELRLSQDLTQKEAASRLGVTQAQWSTYESGKTRPDLDTILLISEKFEMSPFVIIGKSLDKSKFSEPMFELSFKEYEDVENGHLAELRNKKIQEKLQEFATSSKLERQT